MPNSSDKNSGLVKLYYPGRMDEAAFRQLWDRVNWLLEWAATLPAASAERPETANLQGQVQKLAVALQAVQDALTQGSAFVGFGQTQPISGDAVINAAGVGMVITGSTGSATITIPVPSAFRTAIGLATPIVITSGGTGASAPAGARSNLGAAASGANTDLTSITGLTGALMAADGSVVQWGRASVSMSADADQALGAAEYSRRHIEMSGGATLTVTRNITLPTVDGGEWVVANLTTGAQSLVFKTSGGAGVTVANGMTAIVRCDGTDIKRVTADV